MQILHFLFTFPDAYLKTKTNNNNIKVKKTQTNKQNPLKAPTKHVASKALNYNGLFSFRLRGYAIQKCYALKNI